MLIVGHCVVPANSYLKANNFWTKQAICVVPSQLDKRFIQKCLELIFGMGGYQMRIFANPALIKSDRNHYFSLIFGLIIHKISRKPGARAVSVSLMTCFTLIQREKFVNNKKYSNHNFSNHWIWGSKFDRSILTFTSCLLYAKLYAKILILSFCKRRFICCCTKFRNNFVAVRNEILIYKKYTIYSIAKNVYIKIYSVW